MRDLSAAAKLEKNKLASDGAWIILLEINLESVDTIRICRNTENIVWNGHTWTAFSFELDDRTESAMGEIPSITIRVSNVLRTIEYYLQQGNGGVGAEVIVRVVHSKHLDLTEPELEEHFEVLHTKSDAMWVHFILGAPNPMLGRFPRPRYIPNFCRFAAARQFKGEGCGYTGPDTTCEGTLAACRAKGNSQRFGGSPGVATGIYV